MKNRQRTGTAFAAVAVLTLCAAGASGCIRQTETPVIAEKQSAEDAAPEASTTSSEALKSSGSPDSSAQNGPKQADSGSGAWELLNLPERYQADIFEEHVRLKADAPIETPAVSRVPIIEIENSPYTEEDCESVLALLKKETGVSEWIPNENMVTDSGYELPPDSWVAFADGENPGSSEFFLIEGQDASKSYTSDDRRYNFSFGQGNNPDHSPMMWLTALGFSDGGSSLDYVTDLSDFSITGSEREALKKELKKKAEDLLQHLSLSEFQLKTAQWRRLSETEGSASEFKGSYGLKLTYVRSFEGIPTVNRDIGWACAPMSPSQYVEFLYHEDGTLLRMKNINRERVLANLGNEDFLLPFDAIAQIFEQYMKYYQTAYSFNDWARYSGMTVAPANAPDQRPNLSVSVTKVRFGYQLTYDGWDSKTFSKGTGKGRLVPVWAFYGTPGAGYWTEGDTDSETIMLIPQANENGLLLTVNAVDGTVYGNE